MKRAFILSGEGARGGYQAGVLKQLVDKGLAPQEIYGISSGSINAVGYSYLGADKLCKMWSKIDDIDKVFTFNKLGILWKNGLFSTEPTRTKIINAIKGNPSICKSVVSILNIHTGEIQYVSNYDVDEAQYIMAAVASLTIAGIIEADNPAWIDAGARQLLPLKPVIDGGATDIIIILGRPLKVPYWEGNGGIVHVCGKGFLEFIEYGYRFIDLMLIEILLRDIEKCKKKNQLADSGDKRYRKINITVYGPTEFLFDSLVFARAREGLDRGLKELNIIEV